jgi:hypothetical protein
MAAGKEQRNNERERAGTSEKVERSRHGGARLPNGLSKVRRGPGLAQRTDGLCHCSRRAVFQRVPSVYVANPGIGGGCNRVGAIVGRGQALGNGSAGAMAQHLTQTKKARSPANLFRPFGSLALPRLGGCNGITHHANDESQVPGEPV